MIENLAVSTGERIRTRIVLSDRMDEVADPAGDLMDRLLAEERDVMVRRIVRELPDFEREVLCARFGLGPFDTHSLRQLAARLEISLRAAWLADHRARALFREKWEGLSEHQARLCE